MKIQNSKTRLIVAASETDPDMLYATKFWAPDPFIFLERNGKRTLVLSDLEIDRYLKLIDPVLAGKQKFDRALFQNANGPVTAEQIYVNQKVSDLISNAEMEQSDYRRGNRPNVFFGAQKRYFGIRIGAFVFNTTVLIGSTLGLLALLHWILRKQLEVRRN